MPSDLENGLLKLQGKVGPSLWHPFIQLLQFKILSTWSNSSSSAASRSISRPLYPSEQASRNVNAQIDNLPVEEQDIARAMWALIVAKARMMELSASISQGAANSIPAEDPELPNPALWTNRVIAQSKLKQVFMAKRMVASEIGVLEGKAHLAQFDRAREMLNSNPNAMKRAER
jgi:hypothetical protein